MKRSLLLTIPLFATLVSCQLIDMIDHLNNGNSENENTEVVDKEETPDEEKPSPGNYGLSLIQTSDMHGHIIRIDENNVTHYPLAYIAGRADDLRREGGENSLLLLDGGDLYQGASVSNMLTGEPVYTSIDKMGYDAVALGNHEFDWGFTNMVDPDATLPDYTWHGSPVENLVPVLCSNLLWNGERTSCTKDYVIVEKTAVNSSGESLPIKIAIIGAAANYASSIMASKFTGAGYSIYYDIDNVNNVARQLEADGLCDATILLTHESAYTAAEKLGVSAIDLVLGGHSHQSIKGTSSSGLPYLQGGCNCGSYAQASLVFNVGEDGSVSFGSVDGMNVIWVDTSLDLKDSGYLSAEIAEVSDAAIEACSAQLETVIGHIDVSASKYYLNGSGERATVMSNWMCDILRSIGEGDVAFVNSGGVRTSLPLNGLPTRNVTVADVYEIFPFDNAVYVYDLSYSELLQVFEYSMTSGGKSLFSYMSGLDCHFTQTEYDGYSVSSIKSLCKDGVTIYDSGKWASGWADRGVRLVVSEYLATTERTDYYTGTENPLLNWNSTSKLVSSELIDNVSAVHVLKEEAAASGGYLHIDTAPHFLLD